jgi:hypothetical protein
MFPPLETHFQPEKPLFRADNLSTPIPAGNPVGTPLEWIPFPRENPIFQPEILSCIRSQWESR